ncbi:FAD-binding protein [Dethiobacter alkaliphilus]|uniref:FAD-binding protein n=1 Tax=Dethiobacter alkaliphilus TaxID=427926 RepID=UPI002227BDA1|nr:FAD-binding protein [Dethiobacter alkaliphilus]MCW3488984.1 FAD-binding protein [Dethiobacter alkaliphilus]
MARSSNTGSWRPITFLIMLIATGYLIGVYSLRRDVPVYPPLPRSVDVIVMGSEITGEVAALTAAGEGAHVLYIDLSQPDSGGFPAFSPAFWAAGTQYQQEEELEYTVEAMALDIYERSRERGDFNLIMHLAEATTAGLSWLEELTNTEFSELNSETNPGLHFPQEGRAADLVVWNTARQLEDKAVETTQALQPKRLLVENQRIRGVVVENRENETEEIFAQAVILADGGFGSNMDFLEEFSGVTAVTTRPDGSHQGTGLELATDAGALTRDMEYVTMLPVYLPEARRVQRSSFPGAVLLNTAGEVLENEQDITETVREAGGRLYVVYGDEDADINRNFMRMNSLPELASGLGMEVSELQEVTSELSAPYHVAILGNVALTPGGLIVDQQYRVMSEDGGIDGLFAAGEITGGIHGRRAITDLFFSEYITSARIAGNSAAQWARR